MGKSVVTSFSYHLSEASIVAQAEDKAKEQGKSFSEYLIQLVKEDVKKNDQAQVSSISILNPDYQSTIDQQATLDKYFPNWIVKYKDWKLQNKIQDSLDQEQKREAFIMLNHTVKRWRSRM